MKKVLIGTVTLERDVEMWNNQFSYAASYERLMVKKGEYPIYAYADDLERKDGTYLGWRNYIGYDGTVIASNVGGKPGEPTLYHVMTRDYLLADMFLDGYSYCNGVRETYELRPEWTIKIHDFVSSFDNKRVFIKEIVLMDGEELCYMD